MFNVAIPTYIFILHMLVSPNKVKMVDTVTNAEYTCKSEANSKITDLMINNVYDCICECKTKGCLQVERESTDRSTSNKHIIHTDDINVNNSHNKHEWSTKASVGDVVCLGATFIIVVIQLSVLIFYVFKDHDSTEAKA